MASQSQFGVTGRARFLPAAESALAAGLSVLVAVLVLAPLLAVVLAAVQDGAGISARWLATALASTRIIGNTLFVAVGPTLPAVPVGGPVAPVLARSDT